MSSSSSASRTFSAMARLISRLALCKRLACRQSKGKSASTAQVTFHPDLPAVHFNQCFTNGQAKAGAFGNLLCCLGRLIKLLKDSVSFMPGNARTGINDGDLDPVVNRLVNSNGDLTVRGRKFNCVTNKVHQNLNDFIAVRPRAAIAIV